MLRRTVGDKVILSNRSTGNKGHKKLSPEGLARLKKVKEIMAQKYKFIRASEFAGKGKTLEVLDVDTEANGKFGPTVQLKVKEPKSSKERIWNITSIRALRAVTPLLEEDITLIHVWTTGTGTDTMYHVKEVDEHQHQESKAVKRRKGTRRR